jgi:hypothetical protein
MLDPADVELQSPGSLPPPMPAAREPRPKAPWVVAAAVVSVAVGAVWFFVASRQAERAAAPPADARAVAETVAPRAPVAALQQTDLPPLAETDALVRKLVAALSAHPLVVRWLATGGLIRDFVVVVENIAHGASPARHLTALRPAGSFRVTGEDDLRIDPRGYDRYTPIAAAVDSIDADGAARLYALLKPRIDEAYAELGRSEPFDVALERAIVALVQTPALDGSVRLVPTGGVTFAFEDPRLERLAPAQKQLARAGPANARVIQRKLREIGMRLGVPQERLR